MHKFYMMLALVASALFMGCGDKDVEDSGESQDSAEDSGGDDSGDDSGSAE